MEIVFQFGKHSIWFSTPMCSKQVSDGDNHCIQREYQIINNQNERIKKKLNQRSISEGFQEGFWPFNECPTIFLGLNFSTPLKTYERISSNSIIC